ncbi:MAG TPA: prenyltransferase/squalene oxidase repeat-containing protein [Planctomycetota bacterium]|nr:prenyltransferase/squalene oxidase repeat-containing protein [Planctomycetota bacterium]
MPLKRRGSMLAGLLVLGLAGSSVSAADLKEAMDRGTRWLTGKQNPDGGYGPYGEFRVKNTSDVGITAFVLYAIAKNPRGYKAADGPFVSRAVDFLLSRQQPDGGFYDTKDPTLQNYKTSVVVLALNTLDRAKYAGPIGKAQAFIKGQQFDSAQGYREDEHLAFGGVGYGSGLRPDNSNSHLGAEAQKESGLSGSDEFWKPLVVFVTRTLNSETVDPLLKELNIGTTGDGGARYAPGETRGPEETLDNGVRVFSSYGSMTYAALKTLLYAGVDRNDPRVKGAFAWISRNFTVRENPGMATPANPKAGLHGLYYYYHTMAKTLAVYGEAVIKDSKGVEHDWAKELSEHLLSIQHPDGFWQNTSDRWYENIPELDTAYALVALSECQGQISKAARAASPEPSPGPAKGK